MVKNNTKNKIEHDFLFACKSMYRYRVKFNHLHGPMAEW